MRIRKALVSLVFLLLAGGASCCAQTFRDLLATNNVPSASFGDVELATSVQGISKSSKDRTVIAFRKVASEQGGGSAFVGPLQVVQYDRVGDAVLRSQMKMDEAACAGAMEDIYFFTHFTLAGTTVPPAAGCLFVLGEDLQLTQTLYGLSPVEVAPDFAVMTESLTHSAPGQPQRLQMTDLRKRTVSDLYPPKVDALRAKLAREHDEFDEDIHSVATDGKGHFAFIVDQEAKRAEKTVAAQKVFYFYARSNDSWLYCEEELKNVDVDALDDGMQVNFLRAAARCAPDLMVAPEMPGGDSSSSVKR